MMERSLKAVTTEMGDFAYYVFRRFRDDGALNMASSLSYTSLLSLVPLLAIGLALLAAFPAFDGVREQLQDKLFRYVVPSVGEQVQSYVTGFVANAGKLTTAGVVGLVFSAIMVLVTVETSLNQIFRVATARSPVSRLVVYWTALTLGPLLLGASFSLSAVLGSAGALAWQLGLHRVMGTVTGAMPTMLLAVAFSLMYLAVPNRRVRSRHAVVGGVAAAAAFTVLRWGFALYVAGAHAYQSIYGAVATVPIFLFWMYLSWAVVLFGAELTATLPEWQAYRRDPGGRLPARRRLALALNILAGLVEESRNGGQGRDRLTLLESVAEDERPFLAVLERLCREGYVVETARKRYVLGRDLNTVSLGDLVHVLDLGLGANEAAECSLPWMRRIADHLAEAAQAEARALDLPLRDVLDVVPLASCRPRMFGDAASSEP